MKKKYCPFKIYLADHIVEDRLDKRQAASNIAHTTKLNDIIDQMKSWSFRNNIEITNDNPPSFSRRSELVHKLQRVKRPKPHQTRHETETCNLSNQQDESPLFVFSVNLENNISATTLLDSGASKEFISSDIVKKHNLSTEPLSNKL